MSLLVVHGGDLDTCHEIFFAIGAQLAHRQLTAGQDDRLGQVLQQVRQCRGRISHGVSSMKDHKTVILVVAFGNDAYELSPISRIHVAGIDGRRELIYVDPCLEILKLWHLCDEVVEVERFQCSCLLIAAHTNGTPCINEKYLSGDTRCVIVIHSCRSCKAF